MRCEEEENGENGEGGSVAFSEEGGSRILLLRKEGGRVWLRRNKVV